MNAPSRTKAPVLVYGANGYTARLVIGALQATGAEVIVAGRNAQAISALALELGLPGRTFSLADARDVDAALCGVGALFNAAGPFHHTAMPLVDACLRQRVDYLDLSGEIVPLAYAAACDQLARRLGVMLLPAIGFDVVPSDCLAVHLHDLLPEADSLTLSISASNLLSRGSAATLVEHAGEWVQSRRGGSLEAMSFRVQTRWADFGAGNRPTLAVTWGDLITAFHSTRIPNIEVYFEATAFRCLAVGANQCWGGALRNPVLAQLLGSLSDILPPGPSEAERLGQRSVIVGEVCRGRERVRARLVTPEAYSFSASSATRILAEVLGGQRRAGFQTPGGLFGPDFVLSLPGVSRETWS